MAAVRPRSPVPTCPNYVPYSTEFPGQDGGPPPAGATQPGAWYFNTCATGTCDQSGHRRGVVGHRSGGTHGPAARSCRRRRPGGQRAAAPDPHPDPQPVDHGLREPGRVALDHLLDVASALDDGPGLQRRWMRGRYRHRHPVVCHLGHRRRIDGHLQRPRHPLRPCAPRHRQSTTCSHTYATTSAGQPSPDGNPNDAAFPITATITWTVAWAGPDGSAGALPSLTTQGATSLEVAQIESVNN